MQTNQIQKYEVNKHSDKNPFVNNNSEDKQVGGSENFYRENYRNITDIVLKETVISIIDS